MLKLILVLLINRAQGLQDVYILLPTYMQSLLKSCEMENFILDLKKEKNVKM